MSADYTYYRDGRVEWVRRSNGADTHYAYDFQNLTMNIDHYDNTGLMLGLEYAFTVNGLVASITESNATGLVAVTTSTHDARGRLETEDRVPVPESGTDAYWAQYYYDDP